MKLGFYNDAAYKGPAASLRGLSLRSILYGKILVSIFTENNIEHEKLCSVDFLRASGLSNGPFNLHTMLVEPFLWLSPVWLSLEVALVCLFASCGSKIISRKISRHAPKARKKKIRIFLKVKLTEE